MINRPQVAKIFYPLFNGELDKKRIIVYHGGRGGGKTEHLALYFLLKSLNEKNVNFLVCRKYERTNANSLLQAFKNWIEFLGLNEFFIKKKEKLFNIQITSITNNLTGCKFIFTGINDNTIMSIKSIERIKYCWIDEANYLSEYAFMILKPTIRLENSQIFLSFNPQEADDYIYAEFVKKKNLSDDIHSQQVNFYDNPFLSKTFLDDIQRDKKTLPPELFAHYYLGEPMNFNEMQVIDIKKIGRFDDTQKQKGRYSKIIIVIDSAFSTKASADFSVVSAFGKIGDEIHLFRLMRGRWEFNELLESLKSLYFWVNENYGNVDNILIEKKASGQSLIQEILRLTTLQVTAVTPTTDKFTRLTEVIADLPKLKLSFSYEIINYWISDFLSECKQFRADLKHAHDDQVDTMIYALKDLQEDKVDWRHFGEMILKRKSNRKGF